MSDRLPHFLHVVNRTAAVTVPVSDTASAAGWAGARSGMSVTFAGWVLGILAPVAAAIYASAVPWRQREQLFPMDLLVPVVGGVIAIALIMIAIGSSRWRSAPEGGGAAGVSFGAMVLAALTFVVLVVLGSMMVLARHMMPDIPSDVAEILLGVTITLASIHAIAAGVFFQVIAGRFNSVLLRMTTGGYLVGGLFCAAFAIAKLTGADLWRLEPVVAICGVASAALFLASQLIARAAIPAVEARTVHVTRDIRTLHQP